MKGVAQGRDLDRIDRKVSALVFDPTYRNFAGAHREWR